MGELVKPSVVTEILERYELRLSRSLGQHFLIDGNVLNRLLQAADIRHEDSVLEIGPGIGTVTEELCDRAGRVVAIEADSRLPAILRQTLGVRKNLELVEGDALRIDLRRLFRQEEDVKVVSNLPYNIATPLLIRLLRELPQARLMAITVQRELADRYLASPGSPAYGGVSVKMSLFAELSRLARVPPTVFLPPPNVDSTMLIIKRKREGIPPLEIDAFFHFLNSAFGKRRKMLVNALSGGRAPYCSRRDVEESLKSVGLAPSCRAEELSCETLLLIFRKFEEYGLRPER